MKVLIFESEEVLLTAIEFRLKKLGLEVSFCKKGADVDQALKLDEPDLVIIDLDMDEGRGLDIVSKSKALPAQPSILLLADPDEEEPVFKGFAMGIDDFISKPFKPAELIIRVKRILDNHAPK